MSGSPPDIPIDPYFVSSLKHPVSSPGSNRPKFYQTKASKLPYDPVNNPYFDRVEVPVSAISSRKPVNINPTANQGSGSDNDPIIIPEDEESTSNDADEITYKCLQWKCPDCSKTFTRKDHVKRHRVLSHLSFRPYSCHRCPSTFARRDVMKKHLRRCHDDEAEPPKMERGASYRLPEQIKRQTTIITDGSSRRNRRIAN